MAFQTTNLPTWEELQAGSAAGSGLSQFDPGVFKTNAGDYYGVQGGKVVNSTRDPGDFGIGKGPSLAPSASPAPSPSPSPSPGGGYDSTSAILDYMRQQDAARTQQNQAVTDTTRQTLLNIMGQDTNNASINDADIKPQADAYRVASQRGATQERAALAERAASQGLLSGGQSSGAFDAGIGGIQEQAGQHEASFNANLVGQKLQARKQQLMQALQIADALGARSEAQTLQSQIAALDAQLRTTGMGIQSDLGRGQLGLGLLGTVLGSQNQNDRLGLDYASLLTNANRNSYLSALNG